MSSEPPVGPATVPTSLFARLTNILAAPNEVFEEVRDTPYQTSNWGVPFTLAAALGLLFVLVAFAQPGVVADLLQQQVDALERAAGAGKMTAAQVEAAQAQIEQMGPMFATFGKVFGGVAAVLGTYFAGFFTGFLLWLVARVGLKRPVGFWKCMEISGLSSVVTMIGTILTLFLVVYRGSLTANLSPAMLVSELRPGGPGFTLLSALNPVFLWWCAVVALGLGRLTGKSWSVTAIWVFGLYGIVMLVFAGLAFLRP